MSGYCDLAGCVLTSFLQPPLLVISNLGAGISFGLFGLIVTNGTQPSLISRYNPSSFSLTDPNHSKAMGGRSFLI